MNCFVFFSFLNPMESTFKDEGGQTFGLKSNMFCKLTAYCQVLNSSFTVRTFLEQELMDQILPQSED